MDDWFKANLGEALLAGPLLEDVKARFLQALEASARPSGMAVFFRHESEGRLHCEIYVYFSQGSATMAQTMAAEPCPRPSSDGLDLLAGHEDSWSLLRPRARN